MGQRTKKTTELKRGDRVRYSTVHPDVYTITGLVNRANGMLGVQATIQSGKAVTAVTTRDHVWLVV
jgi:hypothetical protein